MTASIDLQGPLQREAALPLWRQIETDLIVDIQNGMYGPGDKLPTESELSATYGVNRHTVRMALASLADSRLVVAQQGRGVYVSSQPFEYRLTRDTRWSDLEQHLEARPNGRLLDVHHRPATRHLAGLLGIAEGSELLITESVRSLREGIATYSYHTFERARFDGIEIAFARSGDLTQALGEFGVETFFRATSWIDCRLPRPREAEALAVPLERPIVVMTYLTHDGKQQPVLYGHSVLPTDSIRLRIDHQEA
jgi:GntR family phosphonate transport system transcriptional regulator